MYNSSKTIENCIKSLLRQTYDDYEIIVVDDCSKDDSVEKVKKYPVKLFCMKKNSGVGAARNVGIKKAKGEIIAFTDSDCKVKENWLEMIYKTFKMLPQAGAVGGSIVNSNHTKLGYADYFLNYSEHIRKGEIKEMRTIPTLNIAYKKELIKGLYFPTIRNSEDTIFNYEFVSKGNKILFNSEIQVYHFPNIPNLKSFLKKQKIYAEGIVYTRLKYNLPGQILVKYRFLSLLCPRLCIATKRIIFSKFLLKYLKVLHYMILGELVFINTIFKYDKTKILKEGPQW